jgi:fructokinase
MILCCGEALIDMIPITSEDGQEGFAPLAGGAIFNTSIALGRLDIPVSFFSGLSSDLFGDALRSELKRSHVDTALITPAANPTTLAFVRLQDGHASYTFYDENSAGRMITQDQLPDLPAAIKAMYFGGISLCAEPAAASYEQLMLKNAAQNVVMMDPNIRPSFVSDEAAYRARISRMVAACDIVKVSDEDLDWIIPDAKNAADQIKMLRSMGPQVVILTEGSKGATAHFGDAQSVSVASQKVEVVDTVGAGDTFNAGVLASLHAQDLLDKSAIAKIDASALETALKFGAKIAAVTVSRKGANPPWAHELT